MKAFDEWLETYFDEVTPREFYRDIFPLGELDEKGSFTPGKYTGVIIEVTRAKKKDGKPKIKKYTVTDDLNMIDQIQESKDFCLMSPISYAGKKRSADAARNIYAIAIDLDKIKTKESDPALGLHALWNGHIEGVERVPKPTYIVSSGTGIHLYYVFDKAIPLFHNIAKQLQKLKHELTDLVWHDSIVDIKDRKEVQQEGIYQGFRIPGTITKQGSRARVFLTGDKVDIEYLNDFVSDKNKVTEYTTKKDLTLEKAKELYPEWYERRIVKKESAGVWHVSRSVYDWWKSEILKKGSVGHRYYCLMILSMYAAKCGMYDAKHNPDPVTREELENDCFEIMEYFKTLTDDPDNVFDESDVMDALEAYDNKWIRYPLMSIEYRSGIQIERNKRNGRKQADHIVLMNGMKKIKKQIGEDFKEGRPPKKDIIKEYRLYHTDATPKDCMRDLQLSKNTVYKWWNIK